MDSSVVSTNDVGALAPLPFADVLTQGTLWNPVTASQILALPFTGPLAEDDVRPFALPLLVTRGLARKAVTGTMILSGKKTISLPVFQGVACLDRAKLGALGLAFQWTEGTYRFDPTTPRRDPANMLGFLGVAIRFLRIALKARPEAESIAALGARMRLVPMLTPARVERIPNLGLNVQENSFLRAATSSGQTAEEALQRGGIPQSAALSVLVLLSAFGFVSWRKPAQ